MRKPRSGPVSVEAAAEYQVVGPVSMIRIALTGFRLAVPWGMMATPDDGERLYLILDDGKMAPFHATEIEMTDAGWAAMMYPADPANGS